MPESEKGPGFWGRFFSKKPAAETQSVTPSQPAVATENLTSAEQANQKARAVEIGGVPEIKDKSTLISMANELVHAGWQSSHLKPSEKHNTLQEYLQEEYSLNISTEIDLPENSNRIDELIAVRSQDILLKQLKKFGRKTATSGAASLATGGALAIFTGGASVSLSVAGFLGGTAGRGLMETLKGFYDVYGRGGELRRNIAKKYLTHVNEIKSAAQDILVQENIDDETKIFQAGKKMIDLLFGGDSDEIVKAKEELEGYEKKWNTASEIVSFAGSVVGGWVNGFMEGSKKFAEQQISKAAETHFAGVAEKVASQPGVQIDLGGYVGHKELEHIGHAVQKFGDQWYNVLKPQDIKYAVEHHYKLTQLGGVAAQAGGLHITALDTGSVLHALRPQIESFITKQASSQWLGWISGVIGTYAVNSAVAWGLEERKIAKELGIDEKFLEDRKALGERYGQAIDNEIKKIKEHKEAKEQDKILKVKVDDIFLVKLDNGERPRIRINKIEKTTGSDNRPKLDIDWDFLDRKEDDSKYANEDFDLSKYDFHSDNPQEIKRVNEKLELWTKKCSYKEWQQIEKGLSQKTKEITELEKVYKGSDKQLIFLSGEKKVELGLDETSEYKVQAIHKDQNIAIIYRADTAFSENNKFEIDLLRLIERIKLGKETPTEPMKRHFTEFNKEKDKVKRIKWREHPMPEFLTDGFIILDTNIKYEVAAIDMDRNLIKLTHPITGESIEFKNFRGFAQAVEKIESV